MVRWSIASIGVLCLSCGGTSPLTSPSALPTATRADIPINAETPFNQDSGVPSLPPETFVGAGDIAQCSNGGTPDLTARLLDAIGGTVFALGDNAYPSGSAQDYQTCYESSWGRHKQRTRPVAGNHEYDSPSATPYYEYFGFNAGLQGVGYYSYNLGNWHIVALNSNVPVGRSSGQAAWLRNDLAANSARCTLAYWHFPLFSSSKHGNIEMMRDFWRVLYDAGADVVLSAHDHVYERFAPQTPDGAADPMRGIREFVVGTGGAPPYPFVDVKENSEARVSTLGVLKLSLKAGGYDWTFIPVNGVGDSGSASCH
jgi:Calcineurin-like phosphoesterase